MLVGAMAVVGALPAAMVWSLVFLMIRQRLWTRVGICVGLFAIAVIAFWPVSVMIAPIALPGFLLTIGAFEWSVRADKQ
jgi:hypothetical protein